LNKFTQINDIITHFNVIEQIKYNNLETEPNVMKIFKQNHKIQFQVQIRLVRNYEIQVQSKSIKKLQIRRIYIQIQIHVHRWWVLTLALQGRLYRALHPKLYASMCGGQKMAAHANKWSPVDGAHE